MTAAMMTPDAAPDHANLKLTLHARAATELMTAQVVSIDQGAPSSQAVSTLVDSEFSAEPVTDEAGRPVGVVSMTDVLISDRNALAYARRVPE